MAPFDIGGRRILVTGGAGGIGVATAKLLAEQGAVPVIADLSSASIEKAVEASGAAGGLIADVTDETSVARMFDGAIEIAGGLDGVVNNAGVIERLASTRRQELSDWRRVIDVNVQGAWLVAREAVRRLPRGGAIVNMASIAGLCGFPASNAYGVGKAALAMMTKTIATDVARCGIRVNAVAPGVIRAPMAEELFANRAEGEGRFIRRTPMGRLGEADEIARAVLFLLSDWASFITGAILPVDGGWSAFGGVGDAS